MGKSSRQSSLKEQDTKSNSYPVYEFHSDYEVINETDEIVGIDILIVFYGNLWELALSRIDHQSDGYLYSILYEGRKFQIYRKINIKKENDTPRLHLVKN